MIKSRACRIPWVGIKGMQVVVAFPVIYAPFVPVKILEASRIGEDHSVD